MKSIIRVKYSDAMDGAKQCVKQHKNSAIDCIKWQIKPHKRMCIKPHKYNHALPAPSGRAWLRATNFRFLSRNFRFYFRMCFMRKFQRKKLNIYAG